MKFDIGYKLLLGWARAMGRLPERVLYGGVRRALYIALYYIARYRRSVTRDNLRRAFPEWSPEELQHTERQFYKHLAELFIDTVAMASISREQLLQRIHITNLAEHEKATAGKDWIAAMAHFGSWEYFSGYQLLSNHRVIGVYKSLKNRAFDAFFRYTRERFGMHSVRGVGLVPLLLRHRADPQGNIAIGMIADQSPFWSDINCWFPFLGRPTAFFEGVERMALKFGMPVYFLKLHKTGVAHYEAEFQLIWDGISPVRPYEITMRYVRHLETAIRAQPECWVWSHKRWKRDPSKRPDIPFYES